MIFIMIMHAFLVWVRAKQLTRVLSRRIFWVLRRKSLRIKRWELNLLTNLTSTFIYLFIYVLTSIDFLLIALSSTLNQI